MAIQLGASTYGVGVIAHNQPAPGGADLVEVDRAGATVVTSIAPMSDDVGFGQAEGSIVHRDASAAAAAVALVFADATAGTTMGGNPATSRVCGGFDPDTPSSTVKSPVCGNHAVDRQHAANIQADCPSTP